MKWKWNEAKECSLVLLLNYDASEIINFLLLKDVPAAHISALGKMCNKLQKWDIVLHVSLFLDSVLVFIWFELFSVISQKKFALSLPDQTVTYSPSEGKCGEMIRFPLLNTLWPAMHRCFQMFKWYILLETGKSESFTSILIKIN